MTYSLLFQKIATIIKKFLPIKVIHLNLIMIIWILMTSKLHNVTEKECENYKFPYKSKEGEIKYQSIHSVLIYKIRRESGCINRDKNSVNNMEKIVKSLISTGERPENYRREQKNPTKVAKPEKVKRIQAKDQKIKDQVHVGGTENKKKNETKSKKKNVKKMKKITKV